MLDLDVFDRVVETSISSIRLVYNLGKSIWVNNHKLGKFDLFLVNELEKLEIEETSQSLSYAIFTFDPHQLGSLFVSQELVFECNSTTGLNSNYQILQRKLNQLLLAWSDESPLSKAQFKGLSYDLAMVLVQHFRVSKLGFKEESLSEQFKSYLQKNFREDVTLSTISEDFYMTSQYFSKIFKEQVGQTFYKYLTNLRLNFAKNLLENGKGNLLHVAMESGFPNVNALNRAFKEKEGLLPSEYRNRALKERQQSTRPKFQDLSKLLKGQEGDESFDQKRVLSLNTSQRQAIQPFWKKIINIGDLDRLYPQQVREQLLFFQSYLQFEFARLKLPIPQTVQDQYNFYREENILDFFVKQGLKFQIVLDFRDVQNKKHSLTYLKQFISHFANRYSIEKVRNWRFELDYMTIFDRNKCLSYQQYYSSISQILASFKIRECLFGPGFVLGDMESVRIFQSITEEIGIEPIQNLTFHIRQDVAYQSHNQIYIRKVTDDNHVRNQLEMLDSLLETNFQLIHIVEWKDYSSHRSWINDTTYKATKIISTTLASFGLLADIAWNIPLDLLLDQESGKLLVGYEGCITTHGIAKPTFYAHYFLHRHGVDFLCKDDYSLVTSSGHNITILTQNASSLNHRYYLDDGRETNYLQADFFENVEKREFLYELEGMKKGKYLIKTRIINKLSGSIQDLIRQVFIGGGSYIVGESEIEFLQKQAIPRISVSNAEVEKDSLSLTMVLEPDEIRHTHIIFLY